VHFHVHAQRVRVDNELVHAGSYERPLVVDSGMPSQGSSTGSWR